MTWSFYVVSILVGMGGAVLWTAQGVFLSENSDDSTLSRNSGIFWALFQARWIETVTSMWIVMHVYFICSLLSGNIYVYFSLKIEIIDHSTRHSLFTILSIVSAVSLVLFAIIIWRSYLERNRNPLIPSTVNKRVTLATIAQTLNIAWQLLKTTHMKLLLIPCTYLGN
jgi:MFS family permease